MRFLILLVAIVFSFSLIGGETHELPLPDDFNGLGSFMAKWGRIEQIVKERHPEFVYCAAAVFHPEGILRYAFFETWDEANDFGIQLYQTTDLQNTLHIFPRVRVIPPRPPREWVAGQASY